MRVQTKNEREVSRNQIDAERGLEGTRSRTHMLVKTRLAAVWLTAYAPAMLDLPSSSLDGRPVFGSEGLKTEMPVPRRAEVSDN